MVGTAFKMPKWSKPVGIVISVLMVALGVLLFIVPQTLVMLMYMTSAAFLVYGIYMIVKYIGMPSGVKQGSVLANGIIISICGILFLSSKPITEALTYSFIFALIALLIGINQLTAVGSVKAAGGKTGLIIFGGIINILIGLFFCFYPLFMELALGYMLGIYLIVGGIALFAESASSATVDNSDRQPPQGSTYQGAQQVKKEVVSEAPEDTVEFQQQDGDSNQEREKSDK